MADSTLSNLTSLTLPSQATDLLLVGRGTARPNKVALSDMLNSSGLAATTTAYGVVQLAAGGGTTAGTVVQADDARLSDTRNPPDGDKGDITVVSGTSWSIDNDAVTNAKLANVGTSTIKGRVTAGTGDPEDLTGTQATTLLDVFTSSLKGLAPASGGGTTNFLRADGTWASPPGGGGGVSFNWTAKTTTYTAVTGDHLLADTSGGAFTITLPATPTAGDYIEFNDAKETWATNNLTIARNGSNIDSLAEDLVCNVSAKIGLTYVSATIGWKVDFIAELGGTNTPTKTYAVFTPLSNQPPATNFATLDTRNSIAVLDFDDGATNESAIFNGIIPEAASLGSGLKVRIIWTATTATSGATEWGVQFEKLSTDIDSDSFDTAATQATTTNATSGVPNTTEITITTIDSLAAGDGFRLKVYRDSSDTTNDTMTGDAELIAVEVRSAS